MSDAILRIGGQRYGGWKRLTVTRSIEQATNAFSLDVTERWPGQPDRWPIRKGDACELILDGTTAITGYVDRRRAEFDAQSSRLMVQGRDRAADIVDSAARRPGTDSKTGDLGSLSLPALARLLCAPHGVDVRVASGLNLGAAFANCSIDPGETVWECLERYARQRAVLVMSDGVGGLLLTRAGADRNPNALVVGENIESAALNDTNAERFATYVALGQSESTDDWNGAQALQPRGTANDPAVRANRVKIFSAEDLATGTTLADRAAWERDVRRGRGRDVVITVSGWSANGRLWQPNEQVPVRIPRWGIDTEMLIKTVINTQDNDGTRSEITVVPKDVYALIPMAPAAGGGSIEEAW